MLDVFATILDNNFKTSTPFIDTVINETLWEFSPFGDYRSPQFFHRLEFCAFRAPASCQGGGPASTALYYLKLMYKTAVYTLVNTSKTVKIKRNITQYDIA